MGGEFGIAGDIRSSSRPKYVDALDGFVAHQVSCGYGHVCFVVSVANLDASSSSSGSSCSKTKSIEDFPLYMPTGKVKQPSAMSGSVVGSKKARDEDPKANKKSKATKK